MSSCLTRCFFFVWVGRQKGASDNDEVAKELLNLMTTAKTYSTPADRSAKVERKKKKEKKEREKRDK